MTSQIEQLGGLALAGHRLDRDQALALTAMRADDLPELLTWANRIRRAHFGNEVKFCSIAAGKVGGCGEDCKWCAQSARHVTPESAHVKTVPAESLVEAARQAGEQGACSFGIVNSGRRPNRKELAVVVEAAGQIIGGGGGMACASLGELDAPTARRLFEAGVRRYNHNLETSRRFFGEVVTTHSYDDRLATLAQARRAGLSLCCGGLFGMGETWADRVDLALTLRDEVGPDVTPLNFLHPIPGTPLAEATPLTPLECLQTIALYRLMLPAVDLKIAGGRHVNLRELQSWMFHAGATSCLVGNYLTTPGRDVQVDRQMVADLGLALVDRFSGEPAAAAGRANPPREGRPCGLPS